MLELNENNLNNVQELYVKVYKQENIVYKDRLERFLEILSKDISPKDERVLVLRYGLDGSGNKSLEELSRLLNGGREKIRQIEIRAIHKLLHPIRRNYILGI